MLWAMRWAIWAMMRLLLSLRLQGDGRGRADVFKRPGPYLIMPNHPAYCDPPNLLVRLWSIFKMRPLLLETNFQNPLFAPDRVAAARHPDAGPLEVQRGEQAARGSRRG